MFDEVNFTIFPDLKIISYGSKGKAKLFGIDILSRRLFNESEKVSGLIFYPQKVLEAKKKGEFRNVWFNGVKYHEKIQYNAQYGTEIDEDILFDDDNPENRVGIGIVFSSRSGKNIKVAIYEGGTLLRHTKMKDYKEDIRVEREITKKFIPFSDYNIPISDKKADELPTLDDWL